MARSQHLDARPGHPLFPTLRRTLLISVCPFRLYPPLTWPSVRHASKSKMGKYDHIAARTDDDIGDEEAGESGFEPSIPREGDHPVM